MSRKEAIEELKAILEMDYKNVPLSKAALEMAISSLETDEAYQLEYERTTKNDLCVDCISRADAIHAVSEALKHTFVAHLDIAYEVIGKLPSVTPQEPVLYKIRAQIEDYLRGVEITLDVLVENDPLRPKMEGAKDTLEECLNLIDKAESENKE